MKQKPLHLQILEYLKNQKEIVNLKSVFEEFLDKEQGLLIQKQFSECRGKGCFKRMSAILFAIRHLQQENQIVLAHIDVKIPENNPHVINKPIPIGNTISETDDKVTGDYQNFLEEHIFSPIYVSDDAEEYIKKKGASHELQQAKTQTALTWVAVIIAIISLVISLFNK